MTTANSKEQASTFFERIRNAMAIYIEELVQESDDENTCLRDQVIKQNAILGKRMKTIGVLQKTINGLEEQIGSKKDWVDKLAKRQQEVYELREIIVDLREKVRFHKNNETKAYRDKNLALQYTVDDLRKMLAILREKTRLYENVGCKGCSPERRINEFKEEIKRLKEELLEVREIAFGYREA